MIVLLKIMYRKCYLPYGFQAICIYLMVHGNNLGRLGQGTKPREWLDKRQLSPLRNVGEASSSEWISLVLWATGCGGNMYFQTCKIVSFAKHNQMSKFNFIVKLHLQNYATLVLIYSIDISVPVV